MNTQCDESLPLLSVIVGFARLVPPGARDQPRLAVTMIYELLCDMMGDISLLECVRG